MMRRTYELLTFNSRMMRFLLIFFVLVGFGLTVFTVSAAFADEDNDPNYELSDNIYPYGTGILQFQTSSSSSQCTFQMPNYLVKSTTVKEGPLPNLDDHRHNFFVVLGDYQGESVDYLQIGLPGGSGVPSYLLDLKNDAERIRGELYTDYENLAVVVNYDNTGNIWIEDGDEKYFAGSSKDVTSSVQTIGPGIYIFGAILLKADPNHWIKDEKCALHLQWPFEITEQGIVTTDEPTVNARDTAGCDKGFCTTKAAQDGSKPCPVQDRLASFGAKGARQA